MTKSEALNLRVEKEVRQMLGELTMQTIILRAALDMMTEQQPQQPAQPEPQTPQPNPARPENPGPSPDLPPPSPNRTPVPDPARGKKANGAMHLKG